MIDRLRLLQIMPVWIGFASTGVVICGGLVVYDAVRKGAAAIIAAAP